MAEQAVLRHDVPDLRSNALRPHLVWGPGDQHLIPRLAERAKAGKVKLVGTGDNRIDTTYISNAIDAHVAALADLLGAGNSDRKAYFISKVNHYRSKRSLPTPSDRASTGSKCSGLACLYLGATLEGIGTILHQKREPLMTRFVARQLATEHFLISVLQSETLVGRHGSPSKKAAPSTQPKARNDHVSDLLAAEQHIRLCRFPTA